MGRWGGHAATPFGCAAVPGPTPLYPSPLLKKSQKMPLVALSGHEGLLPVDLRWLALSSGGLGGGSLAQIYIECYVFKILHLNSSELLIIRLSHQV